MHCLFLPYGIDISIQGFTVIFFNQIVLLKFLELGLKIRNNSMQLVARFLFEEVNNSTSSQ